MKLANSSMIAEFKPFEEALVEAGLEETLAELQHVIAFKDKSSVYDPISKLIGRHSGLFRDSLRPKSPLTPMLPEISELANIRYRFDGITGIISGFESYSQTRDKLVRKLEDKRRLARSADRKVYWDKVLVREAGMFRLFELLCRYANIGSILVQEHFEKAICQIRGTQSRVHYNPMLDQQLGELLTARDSVFLSPSSQSLEAYCNVAFDSYTSPKLRKAFFAIEGVKQSEWDAYVSKGVAILNKLEVALMVKDLTA